MTLVFFIAPIRLSRRFAKVGTVFHLEVQTDMVTTAIVPMAFTFTGARVSGQRGPNVTTFGQWLILHIYVRGVHPFLFHDRCFIKFE